jgi:4-hydroxy-2-oxoheptanedioate aldolase
MNNRIVEKIRDKGHAFGVLAQIDNMLSLEVAASVGMDYVLLDWQHGVWSAESMVNALRTLDATDCIAVPRLAGHLPQDVLWLLDSGYETIVAPMVNTKAEAEALVDACFYPPKGRRSRGRARAGLRGGDEYFEDINRDLLFLPMFETVESLDAIEEILSLDGVGGCLVGPGDLRFNIEAAAPGSSRFGLDEAIQHILDATLERGKIAAYHEATAADAAARIKQGFHMVSIASDVRVLESGWTEMRQEFQESLRAK